MITQEGRPFRLKTELGADALLIERLSGEEGVSTPYRFTLDVLADAPFDPQKLLRTVVTVTIDLPEGASRFINGRVSRCAELGQRETLISYRLEIVPALWFATLASDWRIFQEKSVPEILEEVLKGLGVSEYELKLIASYPKREYCVQCGETNFDFLSRLMEDEGIFYYFVHEDGKHTLVLADGTGGVPECTGQTSFRMASQGSVGQQDIVQSLMRETAVHTAGVTLRDFNYLAPAQPVESALEGTGEARYEYPGGFLTRSEGDRYARIRVEEEEALRSTVRGHGNARAIESGCKFSLVDHFHDDANRAYVALSVRHEARLTGVGSNLTIGLEYTNDFFAIPDDVPYRPPRRVSKPRVRGAQTAVVVGKAGEEIWVDTHGRVKVKFHWDRTPDRDEKSSCWVRVASSWAGKGWGALHLPRIGQEVIVDFLDGDPDQPIVVGRVYNADQTPPFAPGTTPWLSGIKTRSTKGGSDATASELRFSDEKGKEEVLLHAEKNLTGEVENDEMWSVGHDSTVAVKNDEKWSVGKDRTDVVKGKQTVTVTGDDTTIIEQGNQSLTVKKGNQSTTIETGNRDLVIKMGNDVTTVQMGDVTISAKLGAIKLEAMKSIELKVGQSTLKVDQTGVTVGGMMVKIDGKVQTTVSGLMTEVKASAMLTVKGSITMIN